MTRFGWVMTTCFVALSIGVSALFHPAPKLLWNASASVPIGLYVVHRADALHVGELLVVTPPEPLATFLDQRHYLPKGVPLLKRVLALPGQTVCRIERTIIVDGLAIGDALGRDRLGRPLPVWHDDERNERNGTANEPSPGETAPSGQTACQRRRGRKGEKAQRG